VSESGLFTIAGGKLTTYRLMARQIVDQVARRLRDLDGRPLARPQPTEAMPLPGGESADLDVLIETVRRRDVPDPVARGLVRRYGSEAAAVLNRIEGHPELARPMVPGRPEVWAEIPHAVEREMAVHLTDFLMRRVHLYYEMADHGLKIAPAVARQMGRLLGWNEERETAEIAAYQAAVARLRPSS
jgi:glycerol-3-phosphate dehydrogenase